MSIFARITSWLESAKDVSGRVREEDAIRRVDEAMSRLSKQREDCEKEMQGLNQKLHQHRSTNCEILTCLHCVKHNGVRGRAK